MQADPKIVEVILRIVKARTPFPGALSSELEKYGYSAEVISWHYVQLLTAEDAKIFLRLDGRVAASQTRPRTGLGESS